MSLTGCTLQTILPYHTPNDGRNIINQNFECLANGNRDATFNSISATTISATTFYSGSTNLFDLIEIARTGDTTITAGTNIGVIATGSEPENYTINLNGDITLNSITATTLSSTTISASTFYSGSTDLSTIIIAHDDRTRVQGGTNISTGGTANVPIINLDDNITLNSISATTISASTIFSGTTDLSNVIISMLPEIDVTRVQGGTNISTGGTANVPIINLNDNILLSSVSANTMSASTICSPIVYIGNPTSDGTWRIIIDGDNLNFQRRESGNYITKQEISP